MTFTLLLCIMKNYGQRLSSSDNSKSPLYKLALIIFEEAYGLIYFTHIVDAQFGLVFSKSSGID